MSLSHTGRNGTITESTQTVNQRTLLNARGPDGKSTLLANIFTGTPTGLVPGAAGAFAASDRGAIFDGSHVSLFESYKALIRKDVNGGFGFGEQEAVKLDYRHLSAPSLDSNENVVTVGGDGTAINDLRFEGEVLKGHPNLKVDGFNTVNQESGSVANVQITRNDDLPGSNVDMTRADTLGNYFTGAGLRQ